MIAMAMTLSLISFLSAVRVCAILRILLLCGSSGSVSTRLLTTEQLSDQVGNPLGALPFVACAKLVPNIFCRRDSDDTI